METAVYATLDVGRTAGTPMYGNYRLVFEPTGARAALVFAHNTALRYGRADGSANDELMLDEVALWEQRGDVAVCILGADVTDDSATWPELIVQERPLAGAAYDIDGTPHDLVEVVCRDGEIPIEQVTSVRITREYRDTMESGSTAAIGAMIRTDDLQQIDAELALFFELSADIDPRLPSVDRTNPLETVGGSAQ